MVLDVADSVGAAAESVGRVPLEQRPQQRLGLGAEVLRHGELRLQDLVHGLLPVLALEGKPPRQHLVHQHAVAPPVGGEVVAAPEDQSE